MRKLHGAYKLFVLLLLSAFVQGAWAQDYTYWDHSYDEVNQKVIYTERTVTFTPSSETKSGIYKQDGELPFPTWTYDEYIEAHKDEWGYTGDSRLDYDSWGTQISDGWYVVKGNMYTWDRIHIIGNVNLLIPDGAKLNAMRGIHICKDKTLTIYAGSEGTGTLNADGMNLNPAIGGWCNGATLNHDHDAGHFVVHGGIINTRSHEGACIGCEADYYAFHSPNMQSITIWDGQVNTSSTKSCGMGGDDDDDEEPEIYIYGGTLNIQGEKGAIDTSKKKNKNSGLHIAPHMTVSTGGDANSLTVKTNDREAECQTNKYARIEPCDHQGATFTATQETHTMHCPKCLYSRKEEHRFSAVTLVCEVCDYNNDIPLHDVILCRPISNGSGYDYTAVNYVVAEDYSFRLPPCDIEIEGTDFAGWLRIDNMNEMPESIETSSDEILFSPYQEFVVKENIIYVARYRKQEPYAVYDHTTKTLTFYNNGKRESHASTTATVYDLNKDEETTGWDGEDVTDIVFDKSFSTVRPTTMKDWFSLRDLKSIEGMEYLNTSEVTNMDGLFYGNRKMPYIDISSFDMGKVTDKWHMLSLFGDKNVLIYLPKGAAEEMLSDSHVGTAEQIEGRFNLVVTTDGENYTCSDFRLFDGKDFIVPKAFTATKATLDRTFTPGIRSTVFLPFTFDATKFGKVYYFNGETMADETGIRFDPIPVAKTVANAPFILDPKVTMISAENVEVKETNETAIIMDNQMMGVYKCGYMPQNAYYYDATDGKLKRVTDENSTSIKAGHAYFLLSTATEADADIIDVEFGENVATGIVDIDNWLKTYDAGDYYTLDGRKVSGHPARKGIYIHNGRKVVVK